MKVNPRLSRIVRTLATIRIIATAIIALVALFYGLGQFLLTEDIFDPRQAAPYELRAAAAAIVGLCAFGYLQTLILPRFDHTAQQ